MSAMRADFPVLERLAYLNAGSVGPLSRGTADVMAEWERAGLTGGRGAHSSFAARLELRERLRTALADMLGVPPENLALTGSTTDGCHIVLAGLGLRPEDEVVTTDAEHIGLLGTLGSTGAAIRVAPVLGRSAPEALRAVVDAVTPRTRLIALSHVLWLNGQVLPVADIKRETGLPVLVDGAQSVGAIPVRVTDVDYYTVSGQKWLCGPELTGALYVVDPEALRPRMHVDPATTGLPERTGASRLEMLLHPGALSAGLLHAIEELPPDAFERAAELTRHCRQALLTSGLNVLTEADQGTLVSFTTALTPEDAVSSCEEHGVVIRALPNGWLRASCGWWNSVEDVDRLVASLLVD
ncbi:MAG: aminotransferase V [Candidatus Nephthysia bennettiae]|uniref:Aminotransferase class V-fold PLP-dependent enzyme n=1 Tax=Candidatus Nephthysia bennettiae TaxID=3127016 RepID=A0A934K5T2_9BACT|nr:aminotransferase class V-fold PLP-dependent enzyme [Candidatus Dormibacteraeota bacterium]MBJ7612534.1 aminotransferase class V-fold PLP-dependent enzyme [Candidatus Dormibacteraeota bacterium]PZR87543.1 MAG: aminotransferase V [Candidatus Dormibacteraeota bacterium]